MYKKYYDVWSRHAQKYGPRTALLYQVGGFFELYDTENLTTGASYANVRAVAEICQLSLTEHAIPGTEEQTLFGGFPEGALNKFERILVGAGYTVIVVCQRKGASGEVEERVVEHISSPGCFVDGPADRFLVGIGLESAAVGSHAAALRHYYWSAAALELATGRIIFAEAGDRDRLHQFLCIHPPAELIIWTDGGSGAVAATELLKHKCQTVHVACRPNAAAAIEENTLNRWWPGVRQRLEWIVRMPASRQTLAALMDFAADHIPSSLASLQTPVVWLPDGEMRLGNAALEQLGVTRGLIDLMDRTRSIGGKRLLKQRLLRPIYDVVELNRRLDLTELCSNLRQKPEAATIERRLRSLYDMSRLWRKIELGVAGPGDISALLRSWEAAISLVGIVSATAIDTAAAESIISDFDCDALTVMAHDGLRTPTAHVALPLKETGSLVSAELLAAWKQGLTIRNRAVELCTLWSNMAAAHGKSQDYLSLSDAEGGGLRITGTKRRVQAVWTALRDADDKTATVTLYKSSSALENDTLRQLSDAHKSWMNTWENTWANAWSNALKSILERGAVIHKKLEQWTAELDVAWISAEIQKEWLWRRPVFAEGEKSGIYVENLRHPIIERILNAGTLYVPHTLELGGAPTGILLYGMNASGKSSLMKAVGLSIILAQTGFPVPASQMRLVPFTSLFTRILGNDDLWSGLSSFAVEMTEFREVLRHADHRTLVLGDELCSGTESLSATALVAAGGETLLQRKSVFIFATHLHELATLPDLKIHVTAGKLRFAHLRVHYDQATDCLIYDRHLSEGSGSAVYGLEVCRALDLPVDFLERAIILRKSLSGTQTPHLSAYSAQAVVDKCAICSSTSKLEMHHIVQQKDRVIVAEQGFDVNSPGNLVCLCGKCHDDHHAGRLKIQGWEELAGGVRQLKWTTVAAAAATSTDSIDAEIISWVREQRQKHIKNATIKKVAKQLFAVNLTDSEIRSI